MNQTTFGFFLGFAAYAVMQEVLRFIERRKQERMSREIAKQLAESMSQMASAIEKRSAEDEGEEWKRGRSEDDEE